MHQPATFEVDGGAIRKERMGAGLEISDLAERAGISRRYLTHLENGTRSHPRPSKYRALCTALNVTDDRLLAPQRRTPERK